VEPKEWYFYIAINKFMGAGNMEFPCSGMHKSCFPEINGL
jgi:hypothetical protein